ncbi:MAG: hypothetical protein K6C11_03860 [Bacilli bacterium]|nr:hypothetical protein [Bacilli bacterium]
MKDVDKIKMIDNIDSKLNILYKNMSKEDYYDFIDSNKEIKAYNDLLNNISLNILPRSCLMVLPATILVEINAKVFNEFSLFLSNQNELVLV